jgi:signal transduction histidine kinase
VSTPDGPFSALFGSRGDRSIEADQAEFGILIILAALRLGAVIQVAVVCVFLGIDPQVARLALAMGVVVVGFSTAYVIASFQRRNLLSARWGIADVAVGATALVVMSLSLPRPLHIGSWLDWAPGYLNTVAAFIPAWLRSTKGAVGMAAGLGILYAVFTIPGNETQYLTIAINASAYPLFALAGALFAAYGRRLAAQSDRARQEAKESRDEAVAAAAALELARYSFHVHNATGLLEAFARDDLDTSMMPSLRRQASLEANRLRYEMLRGRQQRLPDAGPHRLEDVIWEATSGFGHLPLEFSLTLGRSALLAEQHVRALTAAIVALLYNVQLHARATTVTIHADLCDRMWEVTVTDDGIGFDPTPERFGFGLGTQVLASLTESGCEAKITSNPGEGTTISIKGPVAA